MITIPRPQSTFKHYDQIVNIGSHAQEFFLEFDRESRPQSTFKHYDQIVNIGSHAQEFFLEFDRESRPHLSKMVAV